MGEAELHAFNKSLIIAAADQTPDGLDLRFAMKFGILYSLALLALSLLVGGCGDEVQREYVKIKGSETVLPISLRLAERFTNLDTVPAVSVTGGGSGVGISSLLSQNTDIAMASRRMKLQERLRFKQRELPYEERIIGYDALAVIIHPSNPIDTLTQDQLKKIYTGEVTNWQAFGGPNQNIVALNRESSSGTYGFFKGQVLDGDKFAKLQSVGANGELVEKVSSNEQAIGYIGMAYIDPGRTKPVKIYNPEVGRSVAPTMANATEGTYPIKRPLFYYFLASRKERIQPVLDFILSTPGQELVKSVGYPPNPEYYHPEASSADSSARTQGATPAS
jgi:phosphate transport system substrate-binding protein